MTLFALQVQNSAKTTMEYLIDTLNEEWQTADADKLKGTFYIIIQIDNPINLSTLSLSLLPPGSEQHEVLLFGSI